MKLAVVLAGVVAAASPAFAQKGHDVEVPAGTLGSALQRLASQTGTSIALGDPRLARLRTRKVAGRMPAQEALRRLLRGLPVQLIVIDASTFRLVPRPRASPSPLLPRRKPVPRESVLPVPIPADIVVTATKNASRASDYPGSVRVVGPDELGFAAGGAGTSAIERAVTSLSSTHLGSGREKLFLRGVGDSSFNGPTQATVGQYFGEARVNYSAPDPDLRLYDVARVELLLGPQGSLHGAGTMGGIIRVEPNRPNPDGAEAELLLSSSITTRGDPGAEVAGVLNYPLGFGRGAVRMVGYHVRTGGYIDDPARHARDANAIRVAGARASLSLVPAEGWQIDLGGLVQRISGRNAAYVERGAPRLVQRSLQDQPYSNDFALGSLVLKRDAGAVAATASLSWSRARLADRFDATPTGDADKAALLRANASDVVSGELRVGRDGEDGVGWLVGTAFVDSRARFATTREFDMVSARRLDARSDTREMIFFGEISPRVGPLQLSLGARAVRWESRSRGTTEQPDASWRFEQRDRGWRLLPSVAASASLPGDLLLFLRHGGSYRPPGASASPGGIAALAGDRYHATEIGLRLSPSAERAVAGELSFSVGRWRNVQADILDNSGYLSAANIGDARTLSFDAAATWRLSDRLDLSGGVTLNQAWITHLPLSTIIVEKGRLPNIPDVNARVALAYTAPPGARWPLRLASTFRYVGRSRLGIGPLLDRGQGGYAEWDAEASLKLGNSDIVFKAANILDGGGNRFALGSITQFATRDQYVPQVPRTLTIGLRIR